MIFRCLGAQLALLAQLAQRGLLELQVLQALKVRLDLKVQQVRLVLLQQLQLVRSALELLDPAQRFQTVALQELLSLIFRFPKVRLDLLALVVLKVLLVLLALLALKALQEASRLAPSPR